MELHEQLNMVALRGNALLASVQDLAALAADAANPAPTAQSAELAAQAAVTRRAVLELAHLVHQQVVHNNTPPW